MNALSNWITPAIGDVVLLAKGFESQGQNTGPHFGLVVGRFKIQGSQIKFLLIAPGSSLKPHTPFDVTTQILVKGGTVVGRDTLFYFRADLLCLYSYPSENFLKSNIAQPQPDQVSATKGKLTNASDLLSAIRGYHGNMMTLYKSALAIFGVSEAALVDIGPDKPVDFLK